MKLPHRLLTLATAFSITSVSAIRAGAQTSETSWTSVEGVTIWARFAGADREKVILVRGGREYRVPLSRLTPESVTKAHRLLAPSGNKVAPAGADRVDETSDRFAKSRAGLPTPLAIPRTNSMVRDRHSMPVYDFSERRRLVRTTAYTCSESDHLIYGNRNAIGKALQYTERVRSAAADWSFYPVGTTFTIKGLPYLYVVDDYGSALVGTGTIDIYQPSMDFMNQWGRRNVEIIILRWGSLARSAEILGKRQGHGHCRRMLDNIVHQRSLLASR